MVPSTLVLVLVFDLTFAAPDDEDEAIKNLHLESLPLGDVLLGTVPCGNKDLFSKGYFPLRH